MWIHSLAYGGSAVLKCLLYWSRIQMIKGKRSKLLVKRGLIPVHSAVTNSEPHFVSNTRPCSSFAAIFIWLEWSKVQHVCRLQGFPVCIKHFVQRKSFSPWLLRACNTDMLSWKHPGRSSDSCLCNITWVRMVAKFWRAAPKKTETLFAYSLLLMYSTASTVLEHRLVNYKHI